MPPDFSPHLLMNSASDLQLSETV